MKYSQRWLKYLVLTGICSAVLAQEAGTTRGIGKNGMVATAKPAATAAGIEMLKAGGNAVDAAVSALLVLSVKHIGAFCIGGEVPLIIYDAEKIIRDIVEEIPVPL